MRSVANIGLPDTSTAVKASASRSPRSNREAKADGAESQDESFETSLTRADRSEGKPASKEDKGPVKASKKESKSAEGTAEKKGVSAKSVKKAEDEGTEETPPAPDGAAVDESVVAQSVAAVVAEEVILPQTDSAGVSEEENEIESLENVSVQTMDTAVENFDSLKTQAPQAAVETNAEVAVRPETVTQNAPVPVEAAAAKNRNTEKTARAPEAVPQAPSQDAKAPKDFSKVLESPKVAPEKPQVDAGFEIPAKAAAVENKPSPKTAAPLTPFDTFVKAPASQVKIATVKDIARVAESFSEIRSVATQVREALGAGLREKKNEISIRLDPAEWGQVDVKVSFQKDEIQVQFTAQHAFVKDALERGVNQLRHSFAADGLSLGQVSVGLGGETGAKDGTRGEDAGGFEARADQIAVKAKSTGAVSRAKSSLLDMTA